METMLDEMKYTQHKRGYHPAIEHAVEVLEGANKPLTNHEKLTHMAKKSFIIIADP
jgi:hypothetical protein